jgi:hypothetical protein
VRGEALIYVYTKPIPKDAVRIFDWKVWQKKLESMDPEERKKILGRGIRIISTSERNYCG